MGFDFKFIYKYETESTSTDARALAESGEREGVAIVAEKQTAGRGRRGREFFSPEATGVYFSVVLRPEFGIEEAVFITTAAAVSVARAIEELCGKKSGIKWVNDLYLGEKKICGILCEAVPSKEGGLQYVILGIGINLLPPKGGFPAEIKNIAGSLFEEGEDISDVKTLLPEKILDIFWEYYKNLANHSFIPEYQEKSIMNGRQITVHKTNEEFEATAIGVDNECRLVAEKENGEIITLSSGEVSIKFSQKPR